MASHVTSELAARMGKEVKALATSPPEGVKYVETDADQLTEIHAEMSGPTGTGKTACLLALVTLLMRGIV